MEAVMAAIRTGDYAQAYAALQSTPEAETEIGKAIGAFLLTLAERFDQAEAILDVAKLAGLRVVVNGERERLRRWRDPESNGSLAATTGDPHIPMYVAIAAGFVHGNEDLASRAKAELAASARPISGRLTFVTGEVRPFADLTDSDDATGQMLETYCGEGLLYFPFASIRRVEVLPRTNFMDHLMPRVKIVDADGTASAYVPLLYAASPTAPEAELRTGQQTVWGYLGTARRGWGQRDLVLDGGTLVGFSGVAAIEFD